jgi:hypothetical protein
MVCGDAAKRDARLVARLVVIYNKTRSKYKRKEVYIEKSCKTMEQNGVRVHSSRVLRYAVICAFLASYFRTKGRKINSAFLNNWPMHFLMLATRGDFACSRIWETDSYGP